MYPCRTEIEFYYAVEPCRDSGECDYVQKLDVSDLTNGFSYAINVPGPFHGVLKDLNLTLWKDNLPTNLADLFHEYQGSTVVGIETWDVSKVIDMQYMFHGSCLPTNFNSDIGIWDVSSVTNMYGMFGYAINLIPTSEVGMSQVLPTCRKCSTMHLNLIKISLAGRFTG